MNIFALDKDPVTCARMHCNKHSVKMPLEQCQLLSTAHRVLDGRLEEGVSKTGRSIKRYVFDDEREVILYKTTHVNHPSAIWCRENIDQYNWLCQMTKALCEEYTYRYGRKHKCEEIGMVDWLLNNTPKNIAVSGGFKYPTPAMPDHCIVKGDPIMSYRNYYVMEKQRMANWSGKFAGREVPQWFTEMTQNLLGEKK